MLSAQESKLVISTLTQRRAWLRKTLEDSKLDADVREEHKNTLNLLESAMKKLASLSSSSPASSDKAGSPKAGPAAKRKNLSMDNVLVLVAEDEPDSQALLQGLLEDIGVKHIVVASDGREAFDQIKTTEDAFDFIFCDWDMPELSGMELYKKAKASNTLRGAHFCMVTGVSEAKKIRQAIQSGVNDYVVKPVDGQTLENKMKATIDARNQQNAS
ncbi:response regulator [Agaribacterium haliotis]|uniref:response regulator n=1 Tax=Agaribacterium haliotis TaxID=2013869 RepID=UPI000BB5605E|nr:response regulator [Agaribacterium haliotis]